MESEEKETKSICGLIRTLPTDLDTPPSLDLVGRAQQVLEDPSVTEEQIYEVVHELLRLDAEVERMEMVIPLLRQYAHAMAPYQAGIKVILQKYGRHLKRITKPTRKMQINVRTAQGQRMIIMIPSLSTVADLRERLQSCWGKMDGAEMRITMYGHNLKDFESLLEAGCIPTAVNEMFVFWEVFNQGYNEVATCEPEINRQMPDDIVIVPEPVQPGCSGTHKNVENEEQVDVEIVEDTNEEQQHMGLDYSRGVLGQFEAPNVDIDYSRSFLDQLNEPEHCANSATQMTPKKIVTSEVQTDGKRKPGRPKKIVEVAEPTIRRQETLFVDNRPSITEIREPVQNRSYYQEQPPPVTVTREVPRNVQSNGTNVENLVRQVQQISQVIENVQNAGGNRENQRSNLIPLLVVLMMAIIKIPATGATIAYDCSKPSQGPKYSLRETEACPEAIPNKLMTSKEETYFIYQESDFLRTTARECIVKRSQTAWYCGRQSYTAMVVPSTPYQSLSITPENCIAAFQEGWIKIDGQLKVRAAKGKIIEERISRIGQVAGDGTCTNVGIITVAGVTVSNAVLVEDYHVELKEYQVAFDSSTQKMMERPYCLATKRSCDTGESTLVYNVDHQACLLTLLKQAIFKEITGELYQDSGPTEKAITKASQIRNNSTKTDIPTTRTPTILMSSKQTDMVRLILRESVSRCGKIVISTNYPGLFVTKAQLSGTPVKVEKEDVDLNKYFNNKMDYLYHQNLLTIERVYQDTIANDCKLNREILRTKLALAMTNADVTAPILPLPEGTFARVMGEVIHTYQCKRVKVELADYPHCTNELPVMYGGIQVFLEPVTRIIIPNAVGIKKLQCSNVLAPVYEWTPGYWITLPDRKKAEPPKTLELMKLAEKIKFEEIRSIQEGGIYRRDDIEAARRFLLFPERRARVLTEIVYKSMEGGESQPNFELLLHPDHFKRATMATLQKVWGKFLVFGQASAGLMGIYIICIIIKLIFTQISSVTQLYRASGFTWRLITGCCPFVARHVLFELQREALTKYGQKLTDLVGNLSADELKVLLDKMKEAENVEQDNREDADRRTSHHNVLYPNASDIRLTQTGVSYTLGYQPLPNRNTELMDIADHCDLFQVNIEVNGTPLRAVIDTGASHSFIRMVPEGNSVRRSVQLNNMSQMIDGSALYLDTSLIADVVIHGQQFKIELYVLPNLPVECLLGVNVIKQMMERNMCRMEFGPPDAGNNASNIIVQQCTQVIALQVQRITELEEHVKMVDSRLGERDMPTLNRAGSTRKMKNLRWERNSEGKFLCPRCKRSYTDRSSVYKHWRLKHQNVPCEDGRKRWRDEKQRYIFDQDNRYVCTLCARAFMYEGNLYRHWKLQHPRENVANSSQFTIDHILQSKEKSIAAIKRNRDIRSRGGTPFIYANINGYTIQALIDTGAEVTVLDQRFMPEKQKCQMVKDDTKVTSCNNEPIKIHGVLHCQYDIGGQSLKHPTKIVSDLGYDAIFGIDLLSRLNSVTIDLQSGCLLIDGEPINEEVDIRIAEPVAITPQSERLVYGSARIMGKEKEFMFEPSKDLEERHRALVATSICTVQNNTVPVRIANLSNDTIRLYPGTKLGTLSALKNVVTVVPIEEESRKFPVVDLSKSNLSKEEKDQLQEILVHYSDVMAQYEYDIGKTAVVKHSIPLIDDQPIKQRAYRIPYTQQEEVQKKIQEMAEHNIIRKSSSPWSSPIVIVKKKDGAMRMCIDFRKLNEVTRKDTYPLPRIDSMLDKLGQSTIFTTLDLQSGYWQIEVEEEDKPKTAFTTGFDLWEFNVLPFGLTGAPATFQRCMNFILMDAEHAMVYIDDIIIYSPNFSGHLRDIEGVLRRLRKANLKVKPSKCEFARASVKFLGHIVCAEGIKPDPANTAKVRNLTAPSTVKEVQQFLGLASYYRKFIKGFAGIAAPLHELVKKDRGFVWTECHHKAFEELRERLLKPPILRYPDMTLDFILMTDASAYAVGAVLGQRVEKEKDHVIAYASKKLNKYQRNYSTIDREAFGIIFAVRQFRHYILGKKVWLLTDQLPLVNVMRKKNSTHRLVRWALELQEYDIDFSHRSGKANGNADFLSRMTDELTIEEKKQINAIHQERDVMIKSPPEGTDEMKKAQLEDAELQQIVQFCNNNVPIQGSLKHHAKRNKHRYVNEGGFLKFLGKAEELIVLPKQYRETVLLQYHDGALGGHRSTRRTLGALLKKYYWPDIERDVKRWCNECQICVSRRDTQRKRAVPLRPIPPPLAPMEITAMDVLGPFNLSSSGNTHIIVFCDYFTKWPEAYPMPNQKAETIAQIFVEHIVYRYGVPKKLLTDQGTNFTSDLLTAISRIFNILRIYTSPYHPQTDGLVERFNRTLANMLSSYTNAKQTDWDLHIPSCLFAYRNAPHASTGETPFYLMYLRRCGMPEDIRWIKPQSQYMDVVDYKIVMLERLRTAWNKAGLQMKFNQETMKEYYDKKTKDHKFDIGDHVLIHHPFTPKGLSPKLRRPFKGPYTVIGVDATNLKLVNEANRRSEPIIVHVNRCKLIVPEATSSRYPIRSQQTQEEPAICMMQPTNSNYIYVNPFVAIEINGQWIDALLDSGSAISVMTIHLLTVEQRRELLAHPTNESFTLIDGNTTSTMGICPTRITLSGYTFGINMRIIEKCTVTCILGFDVILELEKRRVEWIHIPRMSEEELLLEQIRSKKERLAQTSNEQDALQVVNRVIEDGTESETAYLLRPRSQRPSTKKCIIMATMPMENNSRKSTIIFIGIACIILLFMKTTIGGPPRDTYGWVLKVNHLFNGDETDIIRTINERMWIISEAHAITLYRPSNFNTSEKPFKSQVNDIYYFSCPKDVSQVFRLDFNHYLRCEGLLPETTYVFPYHYCTKGGGTGLICRDDKHITARTRKKREISTGQSVTTTMTSKTTVAAGNHVVALAAALNAKVPKELKIRFVPLDVIETTNRHLPRTTTQTMFMSSQGVNWTRTPSFGGLVVRVKHIGLVSTIGCSLFVLIVITVTGYGVCYYKKTRHASKIERTFANLRNKYGPPVQLSNNKDMFMPNEDKSKDDYLDVQIKSFISAYDKWCDNDDLYSMRKLSFAYEDTLDMFEYEGTQVEQEKLTK